MNEGHWDTVKRGRTFSCRGKLTTSCKTICHETLEEDRVEIGASKVDSGCVPSRTRTNNDLNMVVTDISKERYPVRIRTFRGGDAQL